LCTRELLELLAGRGMDCRVLTTGTLDPEKETSLDEVLTTLELPPGRLWRRAKAREQWCSTPCNADLPCIF